MNPFVGLVFFFPVGAQVPVEQIYCLLMCLKDVLEHPSSLPLGAADSQFESYQLQEVLLSLKGTNSSSLKYLHLYVLGLSVRQVPCKGGAAPKGCCAPPGLDTTPRLSAGLGWAAVPAPGLAEGLLRGRDLC